MPLLDDVLAWSAGQALWVQDALRRVFIVGELNDADFDELILLLLDAHGVTADNLPIVQPLVRNHLPVAPMPGVICLTGISEMDCVNRFPAGSSIGFASTGLSIVFGHNGAGKSGVARVLKQVCRARTRQRVLGNAFAANFAQQIPTAKIHYQRDGANQSLVWSMANQPPTELQSVAILDDACAQDYVTSEGDAAFQPFGLGHLESLANKVFPELSRRVGRISGGLDCDATPFMDLAPATTVVGRLLSGISANTNSSELERLGSLSEAENARYAELTAVLSESDAEPKAVALEIFAARLNEVLRQAFNARAYVDNRAITRWRELLETSDTASKTREEVEALIRGEHLLGTGGDAWRQMFNAAKKYSFQDAYPGLPAPFIGEDSKCVLCQTVLDTSAKARLSAFNDFVVSEAAVAAKAAEEAVGTARARISEIDLSLPLDDVLHGEIAAGVPAVLLVIELAKQEFSDRRNWMLRQEAERSWDTTPLLTHEPGYLSIISAMTTALRSKAAAYRAATDHDARKVLEAEKDELGARINFAPHKNAVLALVTNLKQKTVLQKCLRSLDTTFISRQCGTLATHYITDALLANMVAELQELKVSHVAHTLRKRIDRGRTMISMVMDESTAKASDILSEGEKKMAAIAFFLAELAQSDSRSGIVADDPVSSLDHKYRHKVAARLVIEAKQRQVVVLTHDAVFLAAILSECERLTLTPEVMTMGWKNNAPGQVQRGLPWMNKSVEEKLVGLEDDHRKISAEWGDEPSEECRREMANIYARVRGTLERVVREGVLNKTVRPFDDRVQIERVAAVAGFCQDEFDQINLVYLRCNAATDAHDSSAEGAKEPPRPSELAEDIATMRAILGAAAQRRSARKKVVDAAARVAGRE